MLTRLYITAAIGLTMVSLSPATGAAQTQTPASRVELQVQDSARRTISVTFQDAAFRDVIAGFAAFSRATIVVDGAIGNPAVNASFYNVEWRRALDEILEKQGLIATDDRPTGIIKIVRRTPAAPGR
jgi:type II secretory pathway component HofQ